MEPTIENPEGHPIHDVKSSVKPDLLQPFHDHLVPGKSSPEKGNQKSFLNVGCIQTGKYAGVESLAQGFQSLNIQPTYNHVIADMPKLVQYNPTNEDGNNKTFHSQPILCFNEGGPIFEPANGNIQDVNTVKFVQDMQHITEENHPLQMQVSQIIPTGQQLISPQKVYTGMPVAQGLQLQQYPIYYNIQQQPVMIQQSQAAYSTLYASSQDHSQQLNPQGYPAYIPTVPLMYCMMPGEQMHFPFPPPTFNYPPPNLQGGDLQWREEDEDNGRSPGNLGSNNLPSTEDPSSSSLVGEEPADHSDWTEAGNEAVAHAYHSSRGGFSKHRGLGRHQSFQAQRRGLPCEASCRPRSSSASLGSSAGTSSNNVYHREASQQREGRNDYFSPFKVFTSFSGTPLKNQFPLPNICSRYFDPRDSFQGLPYQYKMMRPKRFQNNRDRTRNNGVNKKTEISQTRDQSKCNVDGTAREKKNKDDSSDLKDDEEEEIKADRA